MNAKASIFSGTPLLILTVAFIAGVAFGRIFPQYVLTGAAALVALCFLAMLMRRVVPLFFCAGGALALFAMQVNGPVRVGTGEECRWRAVIEAGRYSPYAQNLTVRVLAPQRYAGGRMMVDLRSTAPSIEPFDTIDFRAVAAPIPAQPAIPYEYSPANEAWVSGATATVTLQGQSFAEHWSDKQRRKREGDVTVTPPAAPTLAERIYGWREGVSEAILHSGIEPEAAYFLDAILTGNTASLHPDVRANFSTAGVSHVLALSGTHVAVIVAFLWFVVFPVRMTGHTRTGLLVTLAALWGYAVLTGLSPSVTRSAIMVTAVMMADILRRESNSLNSLCLAALLILLFRPRELFSPGFQLSFAAVAGILLFSPLIGPQHERRRWIRMPWNWLAVCLAATLTTAPLVALHFHQFPVWFILANIPVCLLLPWIMGAELLLLIFNLAAISAPWLVWSINKLYWLIITLVQWVSHLPSAVIDLWISPWLLLPWALTLAALWLTLAKRRWVWGATTLLLLLFTVTAHRIHQSHTPPRELIVVPDPYHTVYLFRRHNHCYLLTDASPRALPNLRYHLTRRAATYLRRHSIDSLEPRPLPTDTLAFPRLHPPIIDTATNVAKRQL